MQNIRNVWCAVLNYRETAKEVNAATPSEPIFFLKSGSTVTTQPIVLPSFSQDVLYEIEVALQFDEHLQIASAGLALDLTAWDVLQKLESESSPWTLAKSFKGSCPIGPLVPIEDLSANLAFSLEVNGELRQTGNTKNMVFSIQQQISYLLSHYPVQPYDLILTGTPAGAAQIKKGDRLIGKMANYSTSWIVSEC